MDICDISELTSYEKLDVELPFKTRHIAINSWIIAIIVYDEMKPTTIPFNPATRLLAKGPNALAVVINSKATLEDCEHLAGELWQAMGIQIEAGCELYKKACNELGVQLLTEAMK